MSDRMCLEGQDAGHPVIVCVPMRSSAIVFISSLALVGACNGGGDGTSFDTNPPQTTAETGTGGEAWSSGDGDSSGELPTTDAEGSGGATMGMTTGATSATTGPDDPTTGTASTDPGTSTGGMGLDDCSMYPSADAFATYLNGERQSYVPH